MEDRSIWYVGVDGELHFTPLCVITGFRVNQHADIIHCTLKFTK